MKRRGFSAIESSISLALFLIIFLAAFEFFGITRSFFFKLKNAQEKNQAAMAAGDKMKVDLLRAGSGLLQPIRQGAVEGIAIISNALIIYSREKIYSLPEGLSQGESRIALETAAGLSPGREVCVFDEEKAEVKTISSIERKTIFLTTPLEASYSTSESQLALLERTSLFFDEKNSGIRRKVNASSPQPLLDDVLYFEFAYEKEVNLARLRFAFKNNKEKTYELLVYPKNIALGLKNF
jgi:prepilin-type N-terminal cleavage/methylation domain-containing protein